MWVTRKVPAAKKGDHIDLLAEMDILTAISACPADNVVNDYRPKPLGHHNFRIARKGSRGSGPSGRNSYLEGGPMDRKVILDDVIPARHGKAYEVKKGQVLQIYLVEDMQVGDCVFFNAHDYKEWWHLGQTWTLSNHLGTGTAKSFKHFYSKPPRETSC